MKKTSIQTLVLTVLIEGVTVLLRFGLELESTRDTAATIGVMTGGVRIHHGYVGLVVILVVLALWRRIAPPVRAWSLASGLALALSDLIHHFVVLNLAVGDPQFDLFYS